EAESLFERDDHLGASRMTDEMPDIGEMPSVPREELVGGRAQIALDERGDIARENRLEPVLGDIPSHDVERIGPGELAALGQNRSVPVAGDHRRGRTVAEKGGRDEIALGEVAAAKAQGAQLDDEEEDARALRSRSRPISIASRLGVAMPVVETVTTASICAASRSAAASALRAASSISDSACSR